MIQKNQIPKFQSESEEAGWWDRRRDETDRSMAEAIAAGHTTKLADVLQRARNRHGKDQSVSITVDSDDVRRAR